MKLFVCASNDLQTEVIDFVRKSIDNRIERCRRLNRSLADAASSLIADLVVQLGAINISGSSSSRSTTFSSFHAPHQPGASLPSASSALDRLQSFAEASGRFLVDLSVRKSSVVVPDRASATDPLLRSTTEARRHGVDLRRSWSRYVDAESAVWNALVGADDDLLRGFYLAVRADISELSSHPERADSLLALLRLATGIDNSSSGMKSW